MSYILVAMISASFGFVFAGLLIAGKDDDKPVKQVHICNHDNVHCENVCCVDCKANSDCPYKCKTFNPDVCGQSK